ncbi:hypothetical protein NUU61_003551 [Penicillium alfredii]|uniref:Aminoglycoside phosphotransferase domain-containing protein n=1 Tax=Penicillium alfredii TaxID=1506179 RepID=A0A9W9FJM8_9EURO|nr:uncharacterized protein NUU61_003551 [Penicillium alfredii]KAJ5101329.1 hypothetical protein NUU61_003551 [Penicillium alfredii]
MDCHKGLDYIHEAEEDIWVEKINELRLNGRLCSWMTGFHPQQLPCHLEGGFLNGSYNVCQIFIFEDGTTWILRLPRVSSISPEYAEEKVIMEVEALDIIHKKTTIPVPQVKAWGYARDNSLDLGPFLIMEWINGICLGGILIDGESRVIKKDISDDKIEFIYRQMADIMLQLHEIDFERIGNLPTPRTGASVPVRPLTWKVHDILRTGGVNTFGDPAQEFPTVTEYFQHVIGQDWKQLHDQPNSIGGWYTASTEYRNQKVLGPLIPGMVHPEYERGPFKLICDDLGPKNLLVRSAEDLTIVGMVDLEWTYVGPAQLFASAPWWLLQDRPINQQWDFSNDDVPPQEITSRYLRCLDIFKRVLEEEEAKRPEAKGKGTSLSALVKWSETSGAMWLHMLLSSGFLDSLGFPCGHLRRHVGVEWWQEEMTKLEGSEEVKAFVDKKLPMFDRYEENMKKIEVQKALMDEGKITKKEFAALARSILAGEQGS